MATLLENIFSSITRQNRKPAPTKTVGVSGTAIHGGYVTENETSSALTGLQKYKTYSDILANTSIVAAGTRYFLNLLTRADWKVIAADDTPAAVEAKEFIEDLLDDMVTPWHRIIRRGAMYRYYGFSIQEWTAKRRDDGQIGMLDIAPRAQSTIERWVTNTDGSVAGVIQRSPQSQSEIFIPREKVVYLVDDSLNDSPEGLGLFRHLVEPVNRLKRYEQLEGFGFETELRGIPVGRVPYNELKKAVDAGELSEDEYNTLITPMTTFIQNHIKNPALGLILDSESYASKDEAARPANTPLWDLSLLQSDGDSGQQEVAAAIERLNRELARILGVENLLVGDNSGSRALSQDKSNNFFLIVDSTLTELKEAYQDDIIDMVWQLNGFDDDLKPRLDTEAVEFRDIEQITSALRDMAQAGAVLAPDDPAINEVREILSLSPQPELSMLMDALTGGKPIQQNSGDPDEDELPDESGRANEGNE